MNLLKDRLASAPISWGVSEVPGWGYKMAPSRVLEEMASLGILAAEMGPEGYFASGEVAEQMETLGFSIIAGFVPLRYRFPEGLLDLADDLRRTFTILKKAGAEIALLAVGGDKPGYEFHPRLQGPGWTRVADSLHSVQEIARDHGLATLLHPHFGTFIESAEDVRHILEVSRVDLSLDTGHIALAGDDPVAVASIASQRVRHVHLKDVDAKLSSQVRNRQLAYHEAVRQGLFRPLGQGIARISEFITQLESSGYQGWYVLEQDVALPKEPPSGGGPVMDAAESVNYLSDLEDELRGGKVSIV